jgi:hypothetical protein
VDADLGLGFRTARYVRTRSLTPSMVSRPPESLTYTQCAPYDSIQLGLFGQVFGGRQVAHHQKSRDVHSEIVRGLDVLGGDVGLGAMSSDSDGLHAQGRRVLQFGDGSDTRQ